LNSFVVNNPALAPEKSCDSTITIATIFTG
jgi:hypothetical protein